MDKDSNSESKSNDDNFAQYCLQTLAPLINFPLHEEDREIIKSQNSSCNCSKSECLKLYCECFAKGRYCIGCNCVNCLNVPRYESVRSEAISQVINRKNEAFEMKTSQSKGGCVCKKSNCKKKYCKCHFNGRFCTKSCICVECKNMDPSLIKIIK